MLFILAIDPLHCMIELASEQVIPLPLAHKSSIFAFPYTQTMQLFSWTQPAGIGHRSPHPRYFWIGFWAAHDPTKKAPSSQLAARESTSTKSFYAFQGGLSGVRWICILCCKIFTVVHVAEFVDLLVTSPAGQARAKQPWHHRLERDKRWLLHLKISLPFTIEGFLLAVWPQHCVEGQDKKQVQILCWTLVQNKIVTADNLANRGWPHQPTCSVFHTNPEKHRCLNCPSQTLFGCEYSPFLHGPPTECRVRQLHKPLCQTVGGMKPPNLHQNLHFMSSMGS